MPRVLVMLLDADSAAAALAVAAADGASSVRFTEVDLRSDEPRQASGARRFAQLESLDRVSDYDGVLFVTSAPAAGTTVLAAFIESLQDRAARGAFANTVLGALATESSLPIAELSPLRGIVITDTGANPEPEARARHLGARVAKVGAWVRHSLGHEQQDQHHHHHEHHEHHHAPAVNPRIQP